jgi:hypothetical protein
LAALTQFKLQLYVKIIAHIFHRASINTQKMRINTKKPDGMALWRRYGA